MLVLRDRTRGGVAGVLCEILGFDPLYVANEGKLVAIVPERSAEGVLTAMREDERGRAAVAIGRVTAEHPGLVVMRTAIGGDRVLERPYGELLPRIC